MTPMIPSTPERTRPLALVLLVTALCLFLFLLAGACRSPDRGVRTTGASAGPLVLRGGRVIDGAGGPPIENAVLVLDGQFIRAVGTASEVPIPSGARVIELNGATVLPGLISDHSHVGLIDGTDTAPGHYTRENILRQLAQFEAYGVTTVTSLGMNGPLFYELQPELHRGALPGADLFGADRGIGVPSGAPPMDVGADQLYRATTPEQARDAVRETAKRHPSFVKIWVDDLHGTTTKMSSDVYAAAIDEAHRAGLRVAAHIYYLDDARQLVADGVDVLAHGIRDRAVDDDLVAAMKAHKTWYIPTLGLDESFYIYAEGQAFMSDPFFRHALQPAVAAQLDDRSWRRKVLDDITTVAVAKQAVATNERNLKTLHHAGVQIGFGTDSGATPLRIPGFAEHRELKLMTNAGLTPLQAIRSATHDAAALLGLTDRGSLARGKLADFVVVEGNPATNIEDLDRITAVWHRGRRVRDGVESFTP
jgi:imidazolonepropionase-like amidohydrolase